MAQPSRSFGDLRAALPPSAHDRDERGRHGALERDATTAPAPAAGDGRAISHRPLTRGDRGCTGDRTRDRRRAHDAGPGEASQAPGGPMNPYERPVVDRLQSEVAQIPLPPRERWTPPERHRSRLLPALAATVVVVALAVIIAAPVLERVSAQGEGVGAAGSSTAPRAAALACATPDQATSPACKLITGRVVEVLGPELVRITPDALTIAADFENPALFEADARTRIEPAASSIGAAGVKPGG